MSYYQALALQKLGQADRAYILFQGLIDGASAAPAGAGRAGRGPSPRAREANQHYLAGLGALGLGDVAKAKAEFDQAVQISPDLAAASVALAGVK